MNGGKSRVRSMVVREPDPLLALEKQSGEVDLDNVLDMIGVVEDERRVRAAAAVLSGDRALCEQYRAEVREDSALLASIRQALARGTNGQLSRRERTRQLQGYVQQLIIRTQPSQNYAPRSTTKAQGGQL